ncbi:C50 family peptidase [Aspergillus aculeatinus CBS 121060]|uniref:Separin n=1 Tax=Aspergillus aculeatinus CBS 121060 TaxID=1448322 RepID=A0ACD1HDY6_9EURO|nr:separin [Aspergillus aculeatinus CBS 121060]RAH71817.1 separin [Aspergillus aculeatinus CBS 121060]
MTVATLLPDSTLESVKLAVRSSSTCSTATVLSLQTLLRGTSKAPTDAEPTAVRRAARITKASTTTTTTITRTKSTRGTRTKVSAAEAAINTVVEQDAARISNQEKLVLATEVFNTTLKTLSEALKLNSSTKREDSRASTPRDSTSVTRGVTKSPRKTNATALENGIPAVAACAATSLACLRTLKSDQVDGGLNMQLEQGSCILAGRLLSLGLNDMAYKELRGLKKRIQQTLELQDSNGTKASSRKGRPAESEEEAVKERMSDLLSFPAPGQMRPLLGLLVTFQSNALRLILNDKKPMTIQNLAPSLQLSDPSSPANIILAALESGALTTEKAAMQLQLLSNTMLSLSSTTTQTPSKLKPMTSLSLQLLSLEIRCMSWKISGHVCDDAREMWDPMARYLASFIHQNKGVTKTEFATLYKHIVRLQSAFTNVQKRSTASVKDNVSVARIAAILGQLAQDAGCFEEALKLFTESITPLFNGQCLALATVRCKIASLHFQAIRHSTKFTAAALPGVLTDATNFLCLSLKGSSNDLDELLIEAAKLKKAAMSWFGDVMSKEKEKGEEQNNVCCKILEYLNGFIRFLRRYIGRKPTDEDPKEIESFDRRVAASQNIAFAAVDSVLAVGRLSITSGRPSWEVIQPTLLDCQRLLVLIEPQGEKQPGSPVVESVDNAFVKLSNLFWSRYVKEKESGQGYRDLLPILKQSATLLSNCSPSQRVAGFAPLKYERLAHTYMEGGYARESEQAFHKSIFEHIHTGTLDQVISSTVGCFPHRMCQDPKSNGFMLGRVLYALLKLNLRSKKSKTHGFFDDDSLDLSQRGHLMEWQLGVLAEFPANACSDEAFRSTFTLLITQIFNLYSFDTQTIRLLRVVLTILRFSLEHPGLMDSKLLSSVIDVGRQCIDQEDVGEDSDLGSLWLHLKNSVQLTLGLHEGDLSPSTLETVLLSWSAMLRDCGDLESLLLKIGDLDHYLLQMRAIVDYTEIHGLWKLQLSALELVLKTTELQESGDFSEAIIVLSRLVLQYSRLGFCTKASALLKQAEQYLTHSNTTCLAILSYRIAHVGYLLETGDISQAATVLAKARALYEKYQKKEDLNSCSTLSKILWERLVADAAFMSSRLSFAQGSVNDALFFAKLSVRLNCRIWAKIEKLSQKKQDKMIQANDNSELETVVEGMAKLEVAQAAPVPNPVYSQGAPFWPHIGSHHTALLNLASLSAHHGLFQDAIYYGEQALKINKSLNANVRLIASQAQLGSHWIFGGHLSEGQELLEAAESLSKQLESSVELVSLQVGLASLYRAQGRFLEEQRALLEADRLMTQVAGPDGLDASATIPNLEDQMKKLQLQGTARKTRQRAATTTTTTRRTRAATVSASNASKATETPATPSQSESESTSLSHLRSEILRQQAACLRTLRDFEKASVTLHNARKFATSRDSQISLQIGESEHLLADAIRHFATHAVYCVLPESTISLPSLQSPSKVPSKSSTGKPASTRKTRAPACAPARSTRAKSAKPTEDFSVMLSKAGESLNAIFPTATTLGSTLDSHAASRLMSRISMLSHVTVPESSGLLSQSPANMNEIGRIGAFTRERAAISLDKQLANYCDPLLWPSAEAKAKFEEDLYSRFTEDYIEILPENWNVLSLSLSADSTEFVVSRLHKGRSPFLLRLPLKRGSEDDEEDQFTFEDGKEEMKELIKLTNQSAHAAKHQNDRQSKKEWWKNREALDRRMENLLQNIENVWFGGFRGIFSPMPHETESLERFAALFQNVLDKHLPSRQKGRRAEGPHLTLHPNVLELFLGVKDLESQEDPEETLMDLLYFVVDILQFQGERNAYDEIDFDMMVVETLDALRGHHDAVRNDHKKRTPNSTVLVLDKSLHMFPWESLPCLQGLPVCRVPSLECLRDRILQFQTDRAGRQHDFGIDSRNGTYILNPTGDLQTTQGTFEKELLGLEHWKGISKREPTEDEFRHGLETKSLFLYFGHGSGAQYIRGRTIKRLERCAITFLMGCSSGALTEAGEYEPYGTPMNYLHAGSPALVATLWDVTDKDIDRFAKSTFDKWGLFGGEEEAVALDEAVCQSRQACVLKYLNGAAPVIYGIPSVFLE